LPFGEEIPSSYGGRNQLSEYGTDIKLKLKFTEKERDTESGLDFFGARYYSGAAGRFASADLPFADQHAHDPQSWNLYLYVRSNPLRYVDKTGRDCGGYCTTAEGCGQYAIGILKGFANMPTGIANIPNRLANGALSLTGIGFRVPLLREPAEASNSDQAVGMKAAGAIGMLIPFAQVEASAPSLLPAFDGVDRAQASLLGAGQQAIVADGEEILRDQDARIRRRSTTVPDALGKGAI
jgi:RHS repeat-associated protein